MITPHTLILLPDNRPELYEFAVAAGFDVAYTYQLLDMPAGLSNPAVFDESTLHEIWHFVTARAPKDGLLVVLGVSIEDSDLREGKRHMTDAERKCVTVARMAINNASRDTKMALWGLAKPQSKYPAYPDAEKARDALFASVHPAAEYLAQNMLLANDTISTQEQYARMVQAICVCREHNPMTIPFTGSIVRNPETHATKELAGFSAIGQALSDTLSSIVGYIPCPDTEKPEVDRGRLFALASGMGLRAKPGPDPE